MQLSRRQLVCSLVTLGAAYNFTAGEANRFRLAVCNETFPRLNFADMCRAAKAGGYTGLEIAPFTLGEKPTDVSPSRRAELRDIMRSEGLHYAGLHALLTSPENLHVTSADNALRSRSWNHLRRLVDLSADLAGGGAESVMVFGSGKQRTASDGVSVGDAVKRFKEGLAELAPGAEVRRVRILIEPLSPQFTNVVNTLGEAVSLVKAIDSPAVQTMFDTHNSVAERLPHGDLIEKYRRYIYHIHLNEMDGRHPGTGTYDFRSVFRALREISYSRWLSVEVFDFSLGGERIAREAAEFIRKEEAQLR